MKVETTLLKSDSFEEFSGATGMQFARPRPVDANFMHIVPDSELTGGVPTTSITVSGPNVAGTTNDFGNGAYWWSTYPCSHSNVDKAYQVVRALMRAKVIRITTLDKFFTVMDEVVKVV